MADQAGKPKRRLRSAALEEFYAAADTGGAAPLVLADPLDLDGSSFQAQAYLAALLKAKPLPALMTADVELKKEVRKLDSELKTLVYENYNRFISATDTIRKMKNNVGHMEAEMGRLSEKMDRIGTLRGELAGALGGNRAQLARLARVSQTLQKVSLSLSLPHL
jgi:hypothetical protein